MKVLSHQRVEPKLVDGDASGAPLAPGTAPRPALVRDPTLVAQAAKTVAGPSESGAPARVFRRLRLDHLTSGKRFDVRTTKGLEAITGAAITLDGLTRMYEKALPSTGPLANTRVRVTGSMQKGHFAYTVTYIDNLQQRVATARRRLVRHDDGALELYRHGTWVDHDQRGRGFSAHLLRQEVGLITALSDHPDSRLTLWAGGARNPKKSADVQQVGVYVWAKAGFEAAETPSSLALGGDKPRCEEDPGRDELSDVALMRRQLDLWLDDQVEQGGLPKADADRARAAADDFTQPSHFATLSVSDATFATQVGERSRDCAMGKAFLLSPRSPRWEGALFVGRPDSEAMVNAEAYVAGAVQSAGAAEQALVSKWQADLDSKDPAREKAALQHMGRIGGTGLIELLTTLRAARPDLEDTIRDTLIKVRGRYKPPRPKITYSAHGGQARAFSLPNRFADLAKLSCAKLAAVASTDEDWRRAEAALQQLADKHLDKHPAVVADAAAKVYGRFGDDERWLARQTAVQVMRKIPEEGGVPALIEASKGEDDINVMIAIHRHLENAEHPGAVEPSERLAVRIEVMKEEIEKALAEL